MGAVRGKNAGSIKHPYMVLQCALVSNNAGHSSLDLFYQSFESGVCFCKNAHQIRVHSSLGVWVWDRPSGRLADA